MLGERYRVVEVVGSGGMGVVYRAQNVVTAKFVALKWLHPRFAAGVGGAIEKLVLAGANVYAVDLRACGEVGTSSHHEVFLTYLCGKSLVGLHADDVADACRAAIATTD